MNKKYVLGIFITVLLLSINQVFIQYWLAQKKNDANIINIAGKQRMLSQRINTEFYKVEYQDESSDLLKQLFNQWEMAHYSLIGKNKTDDSALIENNGIRQKLSQLNPKIEFIENQLKDIGTINNEAIGKNQVAFLTDMDKVVKELEKDSDNKLNFIIRIEYVLFLLSLAILTFEVLYIYRPIEKDLQLKNVLINSKNKELEYAFKDIKNKNTELEQITYITSHDLKEPVRTINSFVKLFGTKYAKSLDEQGLKMLAFLESSTNRMGDLIKDLLEYSIIGHNKTITEIDCNKLMTEIVGDLQIQITETNAEITWNELPTINALAAELRLLFQNLISNAIKFSKPNEAPIIKIECDKSAEYWTFKISDNGIGIEEAYQEKIFEIFNRLHSKDEYNGTGIGLAHCKKIVLLLKGKIWVESKENVGSTFIFKIKKI